MIPNYKRNYLIHFLNGVAFRQPQNLRKLLCHANLPSKPLRTRPQRQCFGLKTCNKPWPICSCIIPCKEVKSSQTGEKHKLNGEFILSKKLKNVWGRWIGDIFEKDAGLRISRQQISHILLMNKWMDGWIRIMILRKLVCEITFLSTRTFGKLALSFVCNMAGGIHCHKPTHAWKPTLLARQPILQAGGR